MTATMSDIANKCGVSLTTVARALKNKGEISRETKEAHPESRAGN